MSLLLLLGLFVFVALAVYLGYLGYKTAQKKDQREVHEPRGAPHDVEGPH